MTTNKKIALGICLLSLAGFFNGHVAEPILLLVIAYVVGIEADKA